jgi:hypothetical protein
MCSLGENYIPLGIQDLKTYLKKVAEVVLDVCPQDREPCAS